MEDAKKSCLNCYVSPSSKIVYSRSVGASPPKRNARLGRSATIAIAEEEVLLLLVVRLLLLFFVVVGVVVGK